MEASTPNNDAFNAGNSNHLQAVIGTLAAFAQSAETQLRSHRAVHAELTALVHGLYQVVGQLGDRVGALEAENAELQSMLEDKIGVSLSVESPKLESAERSSTLFDAATSVVPNPGPIKTGILKRRQHKIGSLLPPVNTQFPVCPITDKEIIVFFFNSLSRPIVALRLYSRGWGPAAITNVLNEHRESDQPYLRNTCSVKCSHAIKKGLEMYGQSWEEDNARLFKNADDADATDAIRFRGEEADNAVPCTVSALLTGLKKFPEGQDTGLFTKSAKWCYDNHINININLLVKIAAAIKTGIDPATTLSPEEMEECDDNRNLLRNQDLKSLTTIVAAQS